MSLRPISPKSSGLWAGLSAARNAVQAHLRSKIESHELSRPTRIPQSAREEIVAEVVYEAGFDQQSDEYQAGFEEGVEITIDSYIITAEDAARLDRVNLPESTVALEIVQQGGRYHLRATAGNGALGWSVFSDTSKLRCEGARSFILNGYPLGVKWIIDRNLHRQERVTELSNQVRQDLGLTAYEN
jgi:hypothetical protein